MERRLTVSAAPFPIPSAASTYRATGSSAEGARGFVRPELKERGNGPTSTFARLQSRSVVNPDSTRRAGSAVPFGTGHLVGLDILDGDGQTGDAGGPAGKIGYEQQGVRPLVEAARIEDEGVADPRRAR